MQNNISPFKHPKQPQAYNQLIGLGSQTTTAMKFLASEHSATIPANINVVLRVRPLSEAEKTKPGEVCVKVSDDAKKITCQSGTETQASQGLSQANIFTFDKVFGMGATQEEVYDEAARPIIDSVLEGFNGTIFAYG